MPVMAIYVRVSTQRQAQSQSTEQQLERLRAYVLAQNWGLAPEHIFRDDGYSGGILQRPGLDRLRDAVASAQIDRILITAPDRLARNYVHQALLVEELQRHGAEVEFLDRPMSQDPHDQLLLQIRGAVAEYERTLINERMRRGRLRKLRAGMLLPWTQPPYGYRLDPDRPRDPAGVRIDEAQAAVVRDLFVWYADEGATILALIRRLAQLGITSPKGCPTWSPSALRGLLTNPTYTGQVFANRGRMSPSRTRRSALLPVGRRGSTRHHADPAQWIAVGRVPALITQEQFDRAAERLVYNRQMARRNNRVHPYLLRGLVSCGHCQHSCMGRQRPPAYAYYLCRTKAQRRYLAPGERCPARYIPARALEELVWADLCCVLEHPEMIAEAMERARGGHWLPQEWQARRANLQRGRASLGQQIERLTEAYLAGIVGLGEYERRRREAEARLLALEQQKQALLADAERHSETVTLATHADVFCRRVRDGLAAADFERKRALLELLVDRVVVTDSAVEIRYVFPTGPEGERAPFCRLRTDYLEALLAPEPGGRVRGRLRRPRCNQPHRAPGSDARLRRRARPRLGGRGKRGQDGQALGRSRGGFSTKVHLKADLDGLPLAFHLTEGEAGDSPQFEILLDLGPAITPRAAVGDKGYDSTGNRTAARERGICPVIPFKSSARNRPAFFPKALYRARARIEQLVGKLKRFKRIALRCEKTNKNFGSFVAFALGLIIVKSVHRA